MGKPDLITDVTKAVRLGRRVLLGEMTLADIVLGKNGQVRAEEGQATCDKAEGCIAPIGHEGGCLFEAAPVE